MFLGWKNHITGPDFNGLFIANEQADVFGALSEKLAEQHITKTIARTIQISLNTAQEYQLIAFLNVSNVGENYPIYFEDQADGGRIDNVQVVRSERANGNYDFYCTLPQPKLGARSLSVFWSALPLGTGVGHVWIGPVFTLPENRGADIGWEIIQTDLEERPDYTLGGQADASVPNVADLLRFGFSIRNNNAAIGVAILGDDIPFRPPQVGPGFEQIAIDELVGIPNGSQIMARWVGLLEPGQRYQLDYQVNLINANDSSVQINIESAQGAVTVPPIRHAVEFTASSTDLVVGVDRSTNNDIRFKAMRLRKVEAPKRNDDLRSIVRYVGSQRPVIFALTDRELDWIERTAIYGSFEEIDPQSHIRGQFFERSFTIKAWM